MVEILLILSGDFLWLSSLFTIVSLKRLRDKRIRDIDYVRHLPIPEVNKMPVWGGTNIACDKHLKFDCKPCTSPPPFNTTADRNGWGAW